MGDQDIVKMMVTTEYSVLHLIEEDSAYRMESCHEAKVVDCPMY